MRGRLLDASRTNGDAEVAGEDHGQPLDDESADRDPDPADLTGSPGRITEVTGRTAREVREAIHRVKDDLPRNTGIRNPDVDVDLRTGEVYPRTPAGGHGDSIGNIHDHLPE